MVRPNRRHNKRQKIRLVEIQAREDIDQANRARRARERAEWRKAQQERLAAAGANQATELGSTAAQLTGEPLEALEGLLGIAPTQDPSAPTGGQKPERLLTVAEALDEAGHAEEAADDEGGVRGHLITSRRYLRSDARIAADLMTSGVVPREVAESLMKSAYVMANQEFKEGRPRNFVALMRLITLWPRLEIEQRKAVRQFGHPAVVSATQVNVSVPVGSGGETKAPNGETGEPVRETLRLDPETMAKLMSYFDQQGIAPDAVLEVGEG